MSGPVLLTLAVCTMVCPLMAQAPSDSAVVKVVRSASEAVLLIETYDDQGRPLGTGTGFFVDSLGTVVTNHHVMAGASTGRVRTKRESFPVTGWIRVSQEADLVTVRIQAAGPTAWLRLGNSTPPEPGTDLIVIGSPRGLAQTVTTGVSSGLQDVEGRRMLQLSALASPGSSGSPVLDRAGTVRGVVARGRTDAPQLVFAVPVFEVAALLAERDSVKPLATLTNAPLTRVRRADNPYGSPGGLTHMYKFESLVGYPFAYVWLVEAPSGALSGAAFFQHPTGFVDVSPVQTGGRPGRRRGFEFQTGCGWFEGWIRDEGVLAGDVSAVCGQSGSSPFIAVPIGTPPGERRNKIRVIRLYLTRTPGPAASHNTTWAWIAAVTPKNLGEGTVGAMHMWGEILGDPGRTDFTFSRGRSDSTSLFLETADQFTQLRLKERDGTITGVLVAPTDSSKEIALEGFRDDLTYCFTRVEDKASAESVLAYVAKDDKVIGDSLLILGRQLNSPALANPSSGPLGTPAQTPGVTAEKEQARLAARAPLDSMVRVLSGRRTLNAATRTFRTEQLAAIEVCPPLPSAGPTE